MKILNWLKSQTWLVTLGLILGSIALVLAGAKSIKRTSAATRKEAKAVDLMNRGIGTDLKRAGKLVKSAAKDKQKAAVAKEKMKVKLDEIANANDDIDSIASAFNSDRVRRS